MDDEIKPNTGASFELRQQQPIICILVGFGTFFVFVLCCTSILAPSHHPCASTFYRKPINSNNQIKYMYCIRIECKCCWHSEYKEDTKGPWLRRLFVFPFCLRTLSREIWSDNAVSVLFRFPFLSDRVKTTCWHLGLQCKKAAD